MDYDKYIEIMENYIDINWNYKQRYITMLDKLYEEYRKDVFKKIQSNMITDAIDPYGEPELEAYKEDKADYYGGIDI